MEWNDYSQVVIYGMAFGLFLLALIASFLVVRR